MANSFGVSRTPVREAMGQLQAQGLVVIRPQVGSFVFTPSAEDITALCTFRIALEPKASRGFLFRHDRDGAIADDERSDRRDGAGGRGQGQHRLWPRRCCLSRRLVRALRQQLSRQILPARLRPRRRAPHQSDFRPIDVRTRSSFDEHRKLLDFFARGEFTAFEALMTTHITNSGVVYAKALKVD